MGKRISRREYAELFGPTTGDRVRLGDTELWAEVERDLLVPRRRVRLRRRQDAARRPRHARRDHRGRRRARLRDHERARRSTPCSGIVKCDIGIKDGRIAGVGKAGNPQIMDGVSPGMVVGATTDVRSAEGMIATAGAIDVHVHFDSAGLCEEAISAGITTMIGGGLGPVTVGICSSGTVNLGRMLQAAEAFPINFGFLGKGSAYDVGAAARAGPRGRDRPEDPRGLGRDARGDRGLARRRRRAGRAGPDPHRHAQRVRLLRGHDGRDRRPDDPHLPLRGRGRRPRPGHHPRLPERRTACRPRPTRRTRTRSTRSTSTSTW